MSTAATTTTSTISTITSFFKDNLTIVIIGLCISLLFIAIFLLIKKINVQFSHYDSVIQMVNNNVDSLNKRVNDIKFGTIEDIVDKTGPEVSLPSLKPVETTTVTNQSQQNNVTPSSKECKTAEPKMSTQVNESKVKTPESNNVITTPTPMSQHSSEDSNNDDTNLNNNIETKNEDSVVCLNTDDCQDNNNVPQVTEFVVMS